MSSRTRTEHDLLGEREVPESAYYGVHTLRAVENFAISGTPVSSNADFVNALACVKEAAALANRELGLLDSERTNAIVKACEEIRGGVAGPFHCGCNPGRRWHLDEYERE
jgi:aspartate ammonia-lyase